MDDIRLRTILLASGVVVEVRGPADAIDEINKGATAIDHPDVICSFDKAYCLVVVGPTCPHCACPVPHTVGG